MSASRTDRRSFLKTGALVATPVAAFAPAAALADDGTRAKLARLEDEREIEGLTRAFLRRFNGRGGADCGEFLARADAVELDPGLRSIAEDTGAEAALEIAEDGSKASYSRPCRVELQRDFAGNSTLEKMARFQGTGHHRHSESRTLAAEFTRTEKGWAIARLRLA